MDYKKAAISLTIAILLLFPLLAYASFSSQNYLPVILHNYGTPLPTNGPTEPAGEAFVSGNFTYFVAENNDLHIFGEVQNDSERNLDSVKVTVDLLDSEGTFTGAESAGLWLADLPAGDRACFHLLFPNPPSWAVFEFRELEYGLAGLRLPGLVFRDDSGSYDPDREVYSIIGTVQNVHGSPLDEVKVVGTLYNRENRVIGCQYANPNSPHLEPEDVSAFFLFFRTGDLSAADHYRLQAGGRE
jgi:hypothetical protein